MLNPGLVLVYHPIPPSPPLAFTSRFFPVDRNLFKVCLLLYTDQFFPPPPFFLFSSGRRRVIVYVSSLPPRVTGQFHPRRGQRMPPFSVHAPPPFAFQDMSCESCDGLSGSFLRAEVFFSVSRNNCKQKVSFEPQFSLLSSLYWLFSFFCLSLSMLSQVFILRILLLAFSMTMFTPSFCPSVISRDNVTFGPLSLLFPYLEEFFFTLPSLLCLSTGDLG